MKSLKKTTAWKWFSLYIKERDNWTCQTCGKTGKGRFMNAGHYIQAFGHSAVFFDERNVYGQCINCNCYNNGESEKLKNVIIKKHGKSVLNELLRKSKEYKQFSKKELKEISDYYRNKIKELYEKRKNNL